MAKLPQQEENTRIESGVPGLDEVLCGGLLPNRVYLVEGKTGTGKTTLALQFLLAGVKAGERCMLVTLAETEEELRISAASHGWTLDGIDILEVFASQESLTPDSRYTMYHPSEVELAETLKSVLESARKIKPKRLVLDSLTELRLLADDPLRYRRQILALRSHFREQCTIMLIDDMSGTGDTQLHSLAHGLICCDSVTAEYGSLRRRLQVKKLRSCSYREGYHDLAIRRGGLEVFPRLVAAGHHQAFEPTPISSGVKRLDDLLGGGLPKGTSTLIVGPAGSGKSALATQYVVAAAARGERSVMFVFDESIATLRNRSSQLQLDLDKLTKAGTVMTRQVDPAELSPGEFSSIVRRAVEEDGATMVVLDSLTGYLNAMPSERFLALHLHELLSYLGHRGVTTLVLVTQHGVAGGESETPTYASYLADTVVLLRYFEAFGEIRQAVSVIKKRLGTSEKTIRELRIDKGILVGEPITDFEGVLSGTPRFVGKSLAPPEDGGGPRAD